MKSFRNADNVLTAWGYVESNGDDLTRGEPDSFNLEPGKWQLVNDTWIPYTHIAVPQEVTMRQARTALLQSGHLATVNAAIAGMAGVEGDAARIEWEYSQTVQRNRPIVAAMGQILGLTDTMLDDLFILAATL